MKKQRWQDALGILGLGALIVIFFWRLGLTNLVLARGDVLLYFYPLWDYRAEALRSGRIPLWNPYLFMGVPFLANSQAGVLYPFNWPLAWLPSLVAFKIAVLAHVILAGAGALFFARRALGLRPSSAWLGGLLFALGGYLTAQVEHINQLQGLAWLPFAFTLIAVYPGTLWGTLGLAVVLALQLLAGHTQSAFITLVGLAFYSLWTAVVVPQSLRLRVQPLITVIAGAIGAVGLAGAQVIPTLELSGLSQRGGGLPFHEAISFSLSPLLLGRALLPGYGETIFTEYVGYLGISGLLLALIGAWARRRERPVAALAALGLFGLLLALGMYNPLYWLCVQFVPGFNLFRVPARWLVLFAFAGAMLAGVGLEIVRRSAIPRRLILASLLLLGLLALTSPFGERPTLQTVAGWLLVAAASLLLLTRAPSRARTSGLIALVMLELFAASRALPYNHPTAPEAVTSLRPAVLQLLADARSGPTPPPRFLSMSDILFDPGDLNELHAIYDSQLPPDAVRDLIVAMKAKEVLAPNLSLSYHLMAADGFDGGLLPLHRYVKIEELLLPPDRISPDGRLRENVRTIPPNRVLDLLNIGTLITDKTGDAWIDGIYYDLQHTVALSPTAPPFELNNLPPFEATTLGIIAQAGDTGNQGSGIGEQATLPMARISIRFTNGHEEAFDLLASEEVTRLRWDIGAAQVQAIRVEALTQDKAILLRGLTLIDERTGAFQPLTLSEGNRWRLVHSGDVKVYTNAQVLPRATIVHEARLIPDDARALEALSAPDFQPARTVILSEGQPPENNGSGAEDRVVVLTYDAERIVMEADLDSPGILVLRDTYYPGWRAFVDGAETAIWRANLLFRAVPLPAGHHRVEFLFNPPAWWLGLGLSCLSLIALGGALSIVLLYRKPTRE